VAAVGAWLDFNDSRTKVLDAAHRRATVVGFVARDARSRMTAALDDAADRLAAEPPPATGRSAPLGYRVSSFRRDRAVIEVWEAVSRGALGEQPSALWGRNRITLVWEDGWKVSDVSLNASPASEWSASDLAAVDAGFKSFRHVP
jgi:hypothetical protein